MTRSKRLALLISRSLAASSWAYKSRNDSSLQSEESSFDLDELLKGVEAAAENLAAAAKREHKLGGLHLRYFPLEGVTRVAILAATLLPVSSGCKDRHDGSKILETSDSKFESGIETSARTGKIAGGQLHSCAVTDQGKVYCWGEGEFGQLGDGNSERRLAATPVSNLESGVKEVTAGWRHSCAITAQGGVECWGNNTHGQLGNGNTVKQFIPTPVSGLASGVKSVSAGNMHTCALKVDGKVVCWGKGGFGQLGDGYDHDRLDAVTVVGIGAVKSIAAGHYHTCALTTEGKAYCWGEGSSGKLGNGSVENKMTPTPVANLGAGVKAIAAGYGHTCALAADQRVLCWGLGKKGQLGYGSTGDQEKATLVEGLSPDVIDISVGYQHSCALTAAGEVFCWGAGDAHQLGNGTTQNRLTATRVSGLGGRVTSLDAGDFHTCSIAMSGNAVCWGILAGWLENPIYQNSPTEIPEFP